MLFVPEFPILSFDVSCSHAPANLTSAVSEVEQTCPLKLANVCGRKNALLYNQRIASVLCLYSVPNPLIL